MSHELQQLLHKNKLNTLLIKPCDVVVLHTVLGNYSVLFTGLFCRNFSTDMQHMNTCHLYFSLPQLGKCLNLTCMEHILIVACLCQKSCMYRYDIR